MRILLPVLLAAGALATAALASPQQRLDGGFFAALNGDPAALKGALDASAAALVRNPRDADAMVEHGMLTFFTAGNALGKGDMSAFPTLQAGMEELDGAVTIAPDNPRIRVFRGIAYHQGSRGMPEAMGKPLLEKAGADFQMAYDAQAAVLDQLGEHRLGELLQIKGDIESRLGRTAEAEKTYGMIKAKLPNSDYAARADDWLKTRNPLPANQTTCIGCHVTP